MRGVLRSILLSNVLEERTGQHRQVEFDMENNEEHAQKAAPDAHFEKLAGVCDNRRREQKRRGHGDKALAESYVFEYGPIGKPTELFEQRTADEKRLISINDPASHAAEIVQERNQFEPPIIAGELVHEPAGLNGLVCFHLVEPLDCARWQDRIGMKEKKPLTCCLLGPGVHLGCAAFWSVKCET